MRHAQLGAGVYPSLFPTQPFSVEEAGTGHVDGNRGLLEEADGLQEVLLGSVESASRALERANSPRAHGVDAVMARSVSRPRAAVATSVSSQRTGPR